MSAVRRGDLLVGRTGRGARGAVITPSVDRGGDEPGGQQARLQQHGLDPPSQSTPGPTPRKMREGKETCRFEAAERPSHEATIVLAVRYYQIGSNSVPASPVFGDIRFSGNGFGFPLMAVRSPGQ
jgi:hypothetical protein